MSTFLKPTVIVSTALGLLARELTLPQLVWRDAVGDFAGAYNDTISIRLPAYVAARARTLRAGTTRVQDSLFERKVDLTLDTDVYLDIPITDEQLSLDIRDFGAQVLNPMIGGITRKLEDELTSVITGASYVNEISFVTSTDDPYKDCILKARAYLNNAHVPFAGRSLVVGSDLETAILESAQFARTDHIGASAEQAVREAQIGRVAGFDVYSSPAIPSDEAYAFHKTAYVMSNRAPVVPSGAPWGASDSYQGLALRTVRVFDADAVADRIILDSWMGASAVTDDGHYDDDPDTGGKFVPVTNPASPVTGHTDGWENDTAKLVRAVKITVT